MKRILMMVVLAGLMAPAGLMAQKVYKDASNRVILDLTVAAGMPSTSVTSEGKEWLGIPSQSGSMTNNEQNGSINATVFQKLEVAPHDINTIGTIGKSGTMTMVWTDAFNVCKNTSYDNGGWRLPTQRELMLMYIFKPALETIFTDAGINGTAFNTTVRYWNATEANGGSSAYPISFDNGIINPNPKSGSYRVRCVREVND